MRQGITTRYLGPTNTKGSRIKATARKANPRNGGREMSLTVPYQYGSSAEEHCKAAEALATKLGWSGLWIAGGKPEEDGNMYVNLNVGPTDLQVHMSNLYSFREGSDWFYVPVVVK